MYTGHSLEVICSITHFRNRVPNCNCLGTWTWFWL